MQLLPVAALLLAACVHSRPPADPPGTLGATADVTLPAVDGHDVNLVANRGRFTVVHFNSTWSLPGEADLAELRRAREAMPEDVALVEIALDPQGRRMVAPWVGAERIDWPVLLATPEVIRAQTPFGDVNTVPTTFILGRDGRIAWRSVGPLPRGGLLHVLRELEARPGRP